MREIKEIIVAINKSLDDLRPYLEADGGDLELANYEPETRTAEIRLLGNCKNCPMHMMTLRAGIERYIVHKVPEVRRIEKAY